MNQSELLNLFTKQMRSYDKNTLKAQAKQEGKNYYKFSIVEVDGKKAIKAVCYTYNTTTKDFNAKQEYKSAKACDLLGAYANNTFDGNAIVATTSDIDTLVETIRQALNEEDKKEDKKKTSNK